jgi:hypothetical protein
MKYTGWCRNDFNVQGYMHRYFWFAASVSRFSYVTPKMYCLQMHATVLPT